MILGGGIGGLYSAYTLLKENPLEKIVLIEKGSRWGGRIYTDNELRVERGGARFSKTHQRLWSLLEEFDLVKDTQELTNEVSYAEGSILSFKYSLIKLLVASSLDVYHDLKSMTLEEYAYKILSKEEVEGLKNAFGYYAELVTMNAKDAIHLILTLNQTFYVLKHGLSQVIQELVKRISLYPHCTMKINEEVLKISKTPEGYKIKTNVATYTTPWCICTLDIETVKRFSLGIRTHGLFNGPLCRIFCTFDEPWYTSLPKYTSKSPLRIIIPHEKCIQISYSDFTYARFWKEVELTYGTEGVNRALVFFIKEALGLDIPMPTTTQVCFWEYGVAYWTPKTDSEKETKYYEEPLKNFYLCSDAYSSRNQQWMEGSLEMSEKACQKIIAKQLPSFRTPFTRSTPFTS